MNNTNKENEEKRDSIFPNKPCQQMGEGILDVAFTIKPNQKLTEASIGRFKPYTVFENGDSKIEFGNNGHSGDIASDYHFIIDKIWVEDELPIDLGIFLNSYIPQPEVTQSINITSKKLKNPYKVFLGCIKEGNPFSIEAYPKKENTSKEDIIETVKIHLILIPK
ncbi:MAG: hypothetical protein QXF15_03875 [Candidatus Aenigmatarchaeota archaeon]